MTYVDAALTVLEAAGKPLTVREITEEALRRGLIVTAGKTPEQTMAAALYTYVKRHPAGRLVYHGEQGTGRALRGSVRWSVREGQAVPRGNRKALAELIRRSPPRAAPRARGPGAVAP